MVWLAWWITVWYVACGVWWCHGQGTHGGKAKSALAYDQLEGSAK